MTRRCIPEGQWRCSVCESKHESRESMRHQSKLINLETENKHVVESEMSSIYLNSPEAILNIRLSGDRSKKGNTLSTDANYGKTSEPPDDLKKYYRKLGKIIYTEPSSRTHRVPEVVEKCSFVSLDSSTNMNSNIKRSVDCASVPVNTDGTSELYKVEPPKEMLCPPLITFHRRLKRKQNVVEATNKNSEFKDGKSTFDTQSCHKSGSNCNAGGSSPSDSIKSHSITVVLAGQVGDCLKQEPPHDTPDLRNDTELESMPAGDRLLLKHTTVMSKEVHQSLRSQEGPNVVSHTPVSFQPVHGVSEERTRCPSSDVINESILLNQKNSDLTDVSRSIEKDLESKLIAKSYHCHDLNLLNPDGLTALTSRQSNKKLMDILPENVKESQSSSTENCTRVSVDEETDNRIKELQWLESLDKELQETKKQRSSLSSCMENNQIKCRLASCRSASSWHPKNTSESQLNQNASREHGDQQSRSQEKFLLEKLGESANGHEHPTLAIEHSSVCANSLGLYLSFNLEGPEVSAKFSPSMPLPSSNFNVETVHQYDRHLQWHVFDENTSQLRDKQPFENVTISSQMIKGTQSTLSNKYKGFTPEWSEEELDFLWIGVRRHGLNNWNAMLRDPKLCFLKSRVAQDLANQWHREQMKLFNSTHLKLARLSRPDQTLVAKSDAYLVKPACGYLGGHGACLGFSDFMKHKAETRLSLGDKYARYGSALKQNQPNTIGLCIGNPPGSRSPSASTFRGEYRNNLRPQMTSYDGRSSSPHQKPVDFQHSANTGLPHWLREAVGMTARSNSSTLPLSVAHPVASRDEQIATNASTQTATHKAFRRRGILKRKTVTSINIDGDSNISNHSASINIACLQKRFDLLPNLGLTSQSPVTVTVDFNPRT